MTRESLGWMPRTSDCWRRLLIAHRTASSLSSMTGSRLDDWLQAFTSAFSDSGYTSGVVASFSMRQPRTRTSTSVSGGVTAVACTGGYRSRNLVRVPRSLPLTAEVVVIGGGIMGASIAYHLADRGCTRVVV